MRAAPARAGRAGQALATAGIGSFVAGTIATLLLAMLAPTVADLAANLARKLPETIRYTKTQLNWWRDLVWSQTVQHARDWLALSMATEEPQAAVRKFVSKDK